MEKPEGTFWSTQCGARLCSTAVWPKPEGSGPCMWPDTMNSLPCLTYCYRVSPLHRNLQVANFQRHKRAFHHGQVWVTLQLAPCLLLQSPLLISIIQAVILPACAPDASPWMPALVWYCCFGLCLCFMYYSYNTVLQSGFLVGYWTNFVGLIHKLDLQTCSQNGTHSSVGDLLCKGTYCMPKGLRAERRCMGSPSEQFKVLSKLEWPKDLLHTLVREPRTGMCVVQTRGSLSRPLLPCPALKAQQCEGEDDAGEDQGCEGLPGARRQALQPA